MKRTPKSSLPNDSLPKSRPHSSDAPPNAALENIVERATDMLKRTPLARKTPMPRATKPLPARSARQVATSKAISAACPLAGAYCACCGSSYNLSRSHALTRKQFPQHAANPGNMLVLCLEHHDCFEHNKPAFARDWPAVWAQKVGMMRALEPSYCAFMLEKLKLPSPLPATEKGRGRLGLGE